MDDPQIALKIAERMLGTLNAPFRAGGNEVFLSASIGVAFHPRDGLDLVETWREFVDETNRQRIGQN
jgi:GGDEF domain-containing protein